MDKFDPEVHLKERGASEGFIKTISNGPGKGRYMFKSVPFSDNPDNDQQKIERGSVLVEYSFGSMLWINYFFKNTILIPSS